MTAAETKNKNRAAVLQVLDLHCGEICAVDKSTIYKSVSAISTLVVKYPLSQRGARQAIASAFARKDVTFGIVQHPHSRDFVTRLGRVNRSEDQA